MADKKAAGGARKPSPAKKTGGAKAPAKKAAAKPAAKKPAAKAGAKAAAKPAGKKKPGLVSFPQSGPGRPARTRDVVGAAQ